MTISGITSIEPTLAAWQRGHSHQTTLTSGTLNAVPTVGCGAAGGLLAVSIPITWTAPATGVAPTGYVLIWGGTAGAGSLVVTGTATTASIPGGLLSVLGQSIVTVYATSDSWNSPISLTSVKITTISALGLVVSWGCAANV